MDNAQNQIPMLVHLVVAAVSALMTLLVGILLWLLKRRTSSVDEELKEMGAKLDRHEDGNAQSFRRIHQRLDELTKEQYELKGYFSGLKNGRSSQPPKE